MTNELFTVTLFRELNEKGIIYCVWKNSQEVKQALTGGEDIDLLVNRKYFNKFLSVIESYGFKEAIHQVFKYPYIFHYYGADPETGGLIHLHVFLKLMTGESHLKNFHLPYESCMLNNLSMDSNSVYVASSYSMYLLFLIRYYIKISCIPGLILLTQRKSNINTEYKLLADALGGYSLEDYPTDNMYTNDLKLISKLDSDYKSNSSILNKILLGHQVRRFYKSRNRYNIYQELYHRYYQILYRIVNKFIFKNNKQLTSGGIILSVTGSDGTGKSTIVEELCHWLKKDFNVKYVHLGLPPPTLLTIPYRILLSIYRSNRKGTEVSHIQHTRKLSFPRLIHHLAVAYERAALGKTVEAYRNNGYIVICDRYVTHSNGVMDSPQLHSYNPTGWIRNMAILEDRLYKKIPNSDLNVKLAVSLQTAIKRNRARYKSHKETDDEIEFRHSQLKNVSYKADYDLEISAEGTLQETLKLVKMNVWPYL